MTKRIAISGKMGSGKTEVSTRLVRQVKKWGGRSQYCHTAGFMKMMCIEAFGVADRPTLQTMGNEFPSVLFQNGIMDGNNLWVNIAFKQACGMENHEDLHVIVMDSIRYHNEVVMLKDKDYHVFRLKTTLEYQKQRRPNETEEALNHASETALDSWEGSGIFTREFEPEAILDEIVNGIISHLDLERYVGLMANE